MTEKVKKRRDMIINVAFVAMIFGLIFFFVKYLFGVTAPFLLSFFFAVCLQRPLRKLDKKTNNKMHTFWSMFLVIVVLAVIIGPVVLILSLIGKEIVEFISFLGEELNDLPNFLATLQKEIISLLKFLPDGIYTSVSDKITIFFTNLINDFDLSKLNIDIKSITNGLTSGITGVYSVVKSIPSAILSLVIGIIAWIFFTKDYNYIVGFIKRQLPEGKKNLLSETKQIFSKTILKMLRAYGIIMFITFCELFLGLSILNLIGVMNNGYVFMIAIAIAVFDILPVAGSGGILIPWAVVSLILGRATHVIQIIQRGIRSQDILVIRTPYLNTRLRRI